MLHPTTMLASPDRVAVALAAAFLAFGGGLVQAQAPLPQLTPGPYAPGHYDWDFGTVQVANPSSGALASVSHYGRISYPSDGSGGALPPVGTPADPGGFPLVVFGHGRFFQDGVWQTNHLQAGYLMDRLASHGIVATSVNLGVIGSFQPGIEQRGTIMLETFQRTLDLANQPGTAPDGLAEAIDPQRLGLLGHSRGGEGAVAAALLNLELEVPLPILAVGTIAPTDFEQYQLPSELPYMSVYGSKDGDVNNGWPVLLHDRSLAEERVFEYVFGANHFFFTETITCTCEGDADLPRSLHHEIAQGYLAGFMARRLATVPQSSRVFADGPELLPVTAQATILPMYRDPVRFTIDDFETNRSLTQTSIPTPAGIGGFAYQFETDLQQQAFSYYHGTSAFVGGWSTPGALWFAATPVDFDASEYEFLSVQMAQRVDAALNRFGQAQDVSLGMMDADGDLALVPLSSFGTIPYPPSHTGGFFQTFPKKSVLRTTRVPLAAFEAANPLFDADSILFVGWRADLTPTGELAFDRMEFTR